MKNKMTLHSIIDTAFPSHNSSESAPRITTISPTTLFETFIPGYGAIHKFLLYTFGFDVTVLVSFGLILWLTARISRSAWALLSSLIASNYMSEINITSTDEIHTHLLIFLASQHKIKSSRRLMAETPSKSAWELDSEVTETHETHDEEGNIKWLNFSNQEAKSQPRFTPAIGSHYFWFNGTYFQVRRKKESLFDEFGGGSTTFKDKEILTLSCFGRSTGPIKDLIQHAKSHYHMGHNAKTIIKRPAPKDMRRWGGRGSWVKIAERPCRPMTTVVLDEDRKMDVLADINEYLNPVTARWYANRGIPYRRGYLFYGPPGTGKTSLTFALAGVFGLDIHVVSLLEPTLTEEELGMLFTNLPAGCIVLLEDIDTAGLIRAPDQDEDEPSPTSQGHTNTRTRQKRDDNNKDDEFSMVSLTKALKRANEQSAEDAKKGISLSGLLNIIDGVASHEGRVLVMTTNRPEKLDEALIRPGRVDHQVKFGNATREQVRELFERMFADDLVVVSAPPPAKASNLAEKVVEKVEEEHVKEKELLPAHQNGHTNGNLTPPMTPISPAHQTNGHALPPSILKTSHPPSKSNEIRDIATQFASHIPDSMFSPAEIQGFLLKRKKEPRRALAEVSAWVKGMEESRREGRRVINIQ